MQQANPKLDDSYDTLSGNEVAPVYSTNPGNHTGLLPRLTARFNHTPFLCHLH